MEVHTGWEKRKGRGNESLEKVVKVYLANLEEKSGKHGAQKSIKPL